MIMGPNKDRLYIALYARGGPAKMPGGEDRYHWALIIGPKHERRRSLGTRFDVRDGPAADGWTWALHEARTPLAPAEVISSLASPPAFRPSRRATPASIA